MSEEKKWILYVQTSDAPERQYSPLILAQTAKAMDLGAKVYYLGTALKILKPGGILVYSTCSLYPEEGEYIIMNFQDYLEPQNLPKWFSPSYNIEGSVLPGTGRLFPSIHHTQGFFIGKFKKKEI